MTCPWEKLDRYPPVLLRLLARNPDGTALTLAQLAQKPGMGMPLALFLSYSTSWKDVTIEQARAYCEACGAKLGDRDWTRRFNRYTKMSAGSKWSHLRNSPDWPLFRSLLAIFAEHLAKKL